MRHPFFENIDWDKLYNKGYTPPFNPGVVWFPFHPFPSFFCSLFPSLPFPSLLLSLFVQSFLSPFQAGKLDLKNFDPQFTREPVPESINEEDRFQVDIEIDATFSGFSYSEDSILAEADRAN